MCRLHLGAHDHLAATIAELDALIAAAAAAFEAIIARLITIPGVRRRTAEVIVAETGGDMTRFATAARMAARGRAWFHRLAASERSTRRTPRSPSCTPGWALPGRRSN